MLVSRASFQQTPVKACSIFHRKQKFYICFQRLSSSASILKRVQWAGKLKLCYSTYSTRSSIHLGQLSTICLILPKMMIFGNRNTDWGKCIHQCSFRFCFLLFEWVFLSFVVTNPIYDLISIKLLTSQYSTAVDTSFDL